MTTQSPDQSLTQSPAPSKEVEERILSIALKTAHSFFPVKDLQDIAERACEAAMRALAAELGKERESERSGGRVNSSAFWCDNRHVVDYEEAFNIERDLLAQNAQLKRELADAQKERDQLKRENENTWRAHGEMFSRNLALSLAYQRQKDALEAVLASAFPNKREHPRMYAAWKQAESALSETPDVSMLEKVVAALKLAYARGHYCDNVPCPGCECGHVLDSILGRTVSQDECEQFVTSHFIKVSTLQPDHQK